MAWPDGRAPVEFADGRSISFRPIVPADGEALRDLFEQLSPEDRYRRFFNAYHPRPEFCVEQASVWARGGARFVAVLHTPGHEQLIAEAGYSPTQTGVGEVSVTVASGWRGWLGPYLLDALVEHAAAVGVQQLEADVLAENRSMLALLRSRGAVVTDRDGFTQVHMRFPTTNRQANGTPIGRRSTNSHRIGVGEDGRPLTITDHLGTSALVSELLCPFNRIAGCSERQLTGGAP